MLKKISDLFFYLKYSEQHIKLQLVEAVIWHIKRQIKKGKQNERNKWRPCIGHHFDYKSILELTFLTSGITDIHFWGHKESSYFIFLIYFNTMSVWQPHSYTYEAHCRSPFWGFPSHELLEVLRLHVSRTLSTPPGESGFIAALFTTADGWKWSPRSSKGDLLDTL